MAGVPFLIAIDGWKFNPIASSCCIEGSKFAVIMFVEEDVCHSVSICVTSVSNLCQSVPDLCQICVKSMSKVCQSVSLVRAPLEQYLHS